MRFVCPVLLIVAAFVGCSSQPYELASVTGTVRIGNQPVCGGKIMFAPIAQGDLRNAGKPAFGQLTEQGHFTLTTFSAEDGAIVGDHWVTLFRDEETQPIHSGAAPAGAAGFLATVRLPSGRIAVPSKVSVLPNQLNVIDINLTPEEAKKYGREDD
ncbi:MAG: hypothetical protein IT425_08720 [Pirellulales bacterium]|nr:hypothetical protein [Pirellulales bacterium]